MSEEYRLAVALDPEDASRYEDLASAQEAAGELEEATESLRPALELEPNDEYYHYAPGALLGRCGKSAEALEELKVAMNGRNQEVVAMAQQEAQAMRD